MKFVERMKKVHKKAGVALKRTQEEMKRYVDHSRRETEEWKSEDRMLLSTKDLVFKKRPMKKLTERYVRPYVIEEVVSSNTVKLWLPTLMRIYLCYDLKLKGLSSKTTLVLSNIRELNRVPSTK